MHAEKLRIIKNWSKLGLDIRNNKILNKDTWEENKDLWEDQNFNPYYKMIKKYENKIDKFSKSE